MAPSAMRSAVKGDVWSKSFRMAVNIAEWHPTEPEWNKAINCIQKEERERIRLFRYRQDAKASIVGRLLMRYWAKIQKPNLTNAQLHFERSERGRPMLKSLLPNWDFNVSHAGKFTVFVAEENVDAIGVDVMSLEDKRFSSEEKIHDFFCLMTRQFTAEEWMQIKDPQQHDLNAQLATFFRFWTLKESYVKGHGHGLGWNLQRLSFKVNPAEASLVVGQISDNSQLYLDGELAEQWYFAETLLDPQHCVATATKGLEGSSSYQNKSYFSMVTPQTIIDSLEPLNDGKISDATTSEFRSDYLNKIEVKPF